VRVLVLNAGSSSIRFELFAMPQERVVARGTVQRIGEAEAELTVERGTGRRVSIGSAPDHATAMGWLLAQIGDLGTIDAVGHRVVHGGAAYSETVQITEEVEQVIADCARLAPLHNPANLLGVREARRALPGALQVAVFDTAFHQTMPATAYLYALPLDLYEDLGIRRYGFHGTSHRFVAGRAAELLDEPAGRANLITCHLGNGCSMAAIRRGACVDTTMGLTPLEGLVMGTRCGDLDPAIVTWLQRAGAGMTADEVDQLLNRRSGLLGLSGHSNDVRALLQRRAEGDRRAALALDVYCYRIRKQIGAYTAVLGQVAALVFTAGVGENAPQIRQQILDGLEPLGYSLQADRNAGAVGVERDVAAAASPARILVIPTHEELLVARDAYACALRGAARP